VSEHEQPTPNQHYVAELSDLAMGVLDGRERAVVLDHVASCASCAAELEQLTAVADSLVHLAAEVEPPAGFESRVLERLQVRPSIPDIQPSIPSIQPSIPNIQRSKPKIHRGWHRPLLVAAAAAVVALAFGIGWAVRPSTGSRVVTAVGAPSGYAAEASLVTPAGQSTGNVAVYAGYAGAPSWLFMTVSSPTWSGRARCTITSTDGTTHTVGSFPVVAGHQASWGARLPDAASSVHKAELIAPDGHVLASAILS
jgi:hypothetical protein